jgi:2',3'-cyclic-nucleotide 2'-phosphodiesterase (5'-nucleotidase family)
MSTNKTRRALTMVLTLAILFSLVSSAVMAAPAGAPAVPVTFTILHTNDFHGQLEASGSNPGSARIATIVNNIRTTKGAANVLLVDAGDEMQGSLLSNLGDGTAGGKGIPTIATYNAMGYNVATFGNHEFDWGQTVLGNRTAQATYPYVTANIVLNDTGNCATAGWTKPAFADAPYQIFTMGTAPDTVKVAFIGVTTMETPTITVSTATTGLCFKDPADSIVHYYDEMKGAGADVIVVLSHLGFSDGGYGYGIPVYGDSAATTGLAAKLNAASKPVNLIIGGHSHSNLNAATVVGNTSIVQAYYNGRTVGQADVTVATDGSVSVAWSRTTGFTAGVKDPDIDALVTDYATDPAYMAIVNQPIGYSAVDLGRSNTTDNMMGAFIDDAIYDYLNSDAEPTNDVDLFLNNAGGIRTDWCWNGSAWVNTGCVAGTHAAGLLTYGNMFTVLPFGNATVVGDMTGARILEVINYAPNVAGMIQPAGLKYKYYSYKDANPGPQPYAWGAFDVEVYNKTTHAWEALDLEKTYKVGTNEFLAPAGGDGYNGFKYMTNITYWGDMLNAVNAYVTANYGTEPTAYMGPNNDGSLDGRIVIDGDGDTVYDGGGEIVPLTILHHNDSHGNLVKTPYVAYTQLATLIKQEKLHNPTRTLLLSSGDNIQGDSMMYYFKTAPTGFTSNGTAIVDPTLHMNPLIKVFNSMGYDAMVLGNHEFNFGKDVFTSVLSQATFPLLQANVTDTGAYGLAAANILPYVEKTVGGDINVAILGIGNHRVPNYELPSNIPGLTFTDPIAKAQELSTLLRPTNDVVIALTHIGFTENPSSVEIDANVDTNLVANVTGLDALIGGHSHTDPSWANRYGGLYKYLPSIVVDPDGNPVIVGQAYRYNNTLGEVILGLRPLGGGNYDVVSQTGRYLTVTTGTAEDVPTKAIITPYADLLTAYNNTTIGQTTAPIDALQAFTQETNGANLQADAAVYELETVHGIPVDFHLSGAMTNSKIAALATPAVPVTLTIANMFTAMPYENSLLVISMNGPQLKTVLERAYRNYYYYKYVPGYGGYSYYTTCLLDTNFGNQITYNDLNPTLPNGHNVVSLNIGGVDVDFTDASTYYRVSTVNYLAAGSCNFNNAGVSLWPLGQIVNDTQFYVRDAVIDYTTFMGTVSPAIEGRLQFVDNPTLAVSSSTRVDPSPTGAATVKYTVEFTEPVTGVDPTDFVVSAFGVTGAHATNVTGFGTTYEVTVDTGNGNGSIRLDVSGTATILDMGSNALVGGYTGGEVYLISKTGPVLITPTNGENLHSNRPTFDWTDYVGAIGYQIQVSKNATFTLLVVNTNINTLVSEYTPALSLPVNTNLLWRVRAKLSATTYSSWSTVHTLHTATPPTAPNLLSPGNNVLVTNTTPTLDWSQSTIPMGGAAFDYYQVQVDDDATFTSPVVDEDVFGLANHVYTLVAPLSPNTKYYWHVRAWNVDGDYSAWSTTRYFREALTSPTLVAPIGGVVVGSRKPLFDWDVVLGATSYTIQVSRNATFTLVLGNTTILAPITAYTPLTNLPAGTMLYWRVRSNGPNGPSAWSAFETFVTP